MMQSPCEVGQDEGDNGMFRAIVHNRNMMIKLAFASFVEKMSRRIMWSRNVKKMNRAALLQYSNWATWRGWSGIVIISTPTFEKRIKAKKWYSHRLLVQTFGELVRYAMKRKNKKSALDNADSFYCAKRVSMALRVVKNRAKYYRDTNNSLELSMIFRRLYSGKRFLLSLRNAAENHRSKVKSGIIEKFYFGMLYRRAEAMLEILWMKVQRKERFSKQAFKSTHYSHLIKDAFEYLRYTKQRKEESELVVSRCKNYCLCRKLRACVKKFVSLHRNRRKGYRRLENAFAIFLKGIEASDFDTLWKSGISDSIVRSKFHVFSSRVRKQISDRDDEDVLIKSFHEKRNQTVLANFVWKWRIRSKNALNFRNKLLSNVMHFQERKYQKSLHKLFMQWREKTSASRSRAFIENSASSYILLRRIYRLESSAFRCWKVFKKNAKRRKKQLLYSSLYWKLQRYFRVFTILRSKYEEEMSKKRSCCMWRSGLAYPTPSLGGVSILFYSHTNRCRIAIANNFYENRQWSIGFGVLKRKTMESVAAKGNLFRSIWFWKLRRQAIAMHRWKSMVSRRQWRRDAIREAALEYKSCLQLGVLRRWITGITLEECAPVDSSTSPSLVRYNILSSHFKSWRKISQETSQLRIRTADTSRPDTTCASESFSSDISIKKKTSDSERISFHADLLTAQPRIPWELLDIPAGDDLKCKGSHAAGSQKLNNGQDILGLVSQIENAAERLLNGSLIKDSESRKNISKCLLDYADQLDKLKSFCK